MKAIVRQRYGGPEELVIRKLPAPEAKHGQIVIEVKAFGVNHAETYMRKGEWGDVAEVSGIECVGLVESDSDGRFVKGQKVAAMMGGMGRTISGSYAEFTQVPTTNVVPIESDLSWEELAAIPESARLDFRSRMCRCRRSLIGRRAGSTRRNRPRSFVLSRFKMPIGSWSPAWPMEN